MTPTTDFITIIGFGSLLCPESARKTCPSLQNFRQARVEGYARIFNKVDPNSPTFDHEHIANWAFIEKPDHTTLVTVFEIDPTDYPDFIKREGEYDLKSLTFIDETGQIGQGVACCAFETNDDFLRFLENNETQKDHYYNTIAPKYDGDTWRNDIFPRPAYLAFCLMAAKKISDLYVENILSQSYLSDKKTSLKDYIRSTYEEIDEYRNIKWLKDFL